MNKALVIGLINGFRDSAFKVKGLWASLVYLKLGYQGFNPQDLGLTNNHAFLLQPGNLLSVAIFAQPRFYSELDVESFNLGALDRYPT